MMKKNVMKWMGLASALAVSAMPLAAQEANTIEQLKKQLQEMQQNFEKQRQQMEAMQKQLEALEKQQGTATAEQDKLKQMVTTQLTNQPPATAATAISPGQHWRPTDPIRVFGGNRSYMNISFDGLFSAGASTANDIEELQLGAHDPKQRGFTVQNLELTLDGMVDPYFRGQANIIYQIDPEGESFLEVEEAYLETLSLPGRLQVKAGQYFTEFGRLNQFHPHSWDFVDQPLVNGRFLGGDGLRNAGARVSWLAPTPFYSELYLSVQNSQGETAASFRNGNEGEPLFGRLMDQGSVKSFSDLLFVPRYVASFDLTDSQTLVAGVSGAFGPNGSGADTDTQVYGMDLFWRWRPVTQSKGFPFVSWQTEAMLRKYQAGAFSEDLDGDGTIDADLNGDGIIDSVPRETLTDLGFYSQVMWGFRPRWVAGLRCDYLNGDSASYEAVYGPDPQRAERWRISPNLTWYPTEFSKIRLQYNYDDRKGIGVDHSVWLQFEFLLGSHASHKF